MKQATQHTVSANPGGWFDVTSGNSGRVHKVTPFDAGTALCTCEQMTYRGLPCSHVAAVREFAAGVLAAKEHNVFARIQASEADWVGRYSTPWGSK